MFNAKRIETIRKNIQISTLLSDHEKSDWLNLLELMNDKQLSELEEILASEAPQVKTATQNQTAPQSQIAGVPLNMQHVSEPIQKLPPLTHIANMPSDVSVTNTFSSPTNSPQASQSSSTPRPIPPKPNYIKPVSAAPAAPLAQKPAQPSTVPVAPTKPPEPRKTGNGIYKIEHVEDLTQLSLETIRTNTLQSVFDVIKNAIEQNGYFAVLQLIEQSPLYEGYIEAGKQRLGAKSQTAASDSSNFVQEELEFMTDLLRNMRFNRW